MESTRRGDPEAPLLQTNLAWQPSGAWSTQKDNTKPPRSALPGEDSQDKRYSTGLYFINSFTWSKAIDNASGDQENYDDDNSLSSYNQPLNDTLTILYDVPFGKGRHFSTQSKRWISPPAAGRRPGQYRKQRPTAEPHHSPSTQGQVSTLTSYQPNLVSRAPLYRSTGNPIYHLNSAAFTQPSYTHPFGDAGRNIARLPFFSELDFGLHKNFKLWSESK